MGTTFRTVICTLENMTPDHCRILDHKFLPPDAYHHGGGVVDNRPDGKTQAMIDGYKRQQCPVQLTSESGCVMIFSSFGEAAEYLGRQQPVISRSISDGIELSRLLMDCGIPRRNQGGSKVTRERAAELWPIIKAYGEGKTIEYKIGDDKWRDVDNPLDNGLLLEYEYGNDYRIKPKPKTRPMTRGEVLYKVTTTPGMVLSIPEKPYKPHCTASGYNGLAPIEGLVYAIIDKSGEPIDGWHKFEKQVDTATES